MNDDTLLHRIIKPGWWFQGNKVSSQAFRPALEDNKRLSVYDGDQITPEAAFYHYANDPDKPRPIGALAVTVGECAALNLPVIPDPDTFPEHVLIDFTAFGVSRIKRKSGELRDAAQGRGWQFRL